MALQPQSGAPYTTATAAITGLEAWRDRGLGTPVTGEILVRAGVPESISRRTLASLKQLELLTPEGQPTQQFQDLRQARGDDEYKTRLQEWLRGIYADVLQYTDPSTDTPDRVAEAFRTFEPAGQRRAMAALLIGLWKYSGLPVASGSESPPSRSIRSAARRTTSTSTRSQADIAAGKNLARVARTELSPDLPPGLIGLLQQIPRGGAPWTTERRDGFLRAFSAVLDFTVPIDDNPPQIEPETEEATV